MLPVCAIGSYAWTEGDAVAGRSLLVEAQAASCFFRTSVDQEGRKALVQITERCNLHCAHCFVSSGAEGADMTLDFVRDRLIPRLLQARVERVTLTGGEPFVHPDLLDICRAFVAAGLPVGICTNATQTSPTQIAELQSIGDVHVNVSFDGFRAESHGRFRGSRSSFATTLETTRRFAEAGLLQGLLSTPNVLASPSEYADLCEFAADIGAEYVLMNPLSALGRGFRSKPMLEAGRERMNAVREASTTAAHRNVELVHIRFPNAELPLGGCEAGRIIYVFTDGLTAVCPYLVFAARTPGSQHRPDEFTVGNIFDTDIAEPLDEYKFHQRYQVGTNSTCPSCKLNPQCGKGCPAAVVATGDRIGEVDREQCPVTGTDPSPRLRLPLYPSHA